MAWELRRSAPRRNQVTPQFKRLALVARRASTYHSRNILAKNISVCGGRRSAHEWSLMHLALKLFFGSPRLRRLGYMTPINENR